MVHVEIPRDAETLQHRSGRTGRAGKKGTAVIIVPYPRRKRVESMLRGAKINAEWIDPPTAEAIRHNDRTRLLAALLEPAEFDEWLERHPAGAFELLRQYPPELLLDEPAPKPSAPASSRSFEQPDLVDA